MVISKPGGFGSPAAFCLWDGSNNCSPCCNPGASINYGPCRNTGTRHSGRYCSTGDHGSDSRGTDLRNGSCSA
jgi:hypothetical protein